VTLTPLTYEQQMAIVEGSAALVYTCTTPGCEVVGHFTDHPHNGFCAICDEPLTTIYDETGEIAARVPTDPCGIGATATCAGSRLTSCYPKGQPNLT
jgi:ribosomal protein L34E